MPTNMLTKYVECDPEKCPLVEQCPDGPLPGAPCNMKQQFVVQIDRTISDTFEKLDNAPETRLRLDILLKPLFEQLLTLKMGEARHRNIYNGGKMNPIFRDIRQCILAIDKVLSETVKSYKEETKTKLPAGSMGLLQGNGYYEMLCHDGQGSLEDRVGPN